MTEAERLAKARKSVMSTPAKEARLEEWKKTPKYQEGKRMMEEYYGKDSIIFDSGKMPARVYDNRIPEQDKQDDIDIRKFLDEQEKAGKPQLLKIIKDYETGPKDEHMDAGLKLLYEDFKKKGGK